MYIIYKTTCLLNQKYYIGVHKTNDLQDNYLGSGKLLKRALNKYGSENFKKEILFITENREEAFKKEKELVIISENSYNLKKGGEGGFDYINNHKLQVDNLRNDSSERHKERSRKGGLNRKIWENRGEFTEKRKLQSKKNLEKINAFRKINGMSEEQKRKISESLKKFHNKKLGPEQDR